MADPQTPQMSAADGRSGRFVWPPQRPAPATPPRPQPIEFKPPPRTDRLVPGSSIDADLADPVSVGPWHAALDAFEDTWLGVTHPPLRRIMAETGWRPDHPGAWCPRCGQTVGPHQSAVGECDHCRNTRRPWGRLVRLGEYRPPLAALVRQVKFTRFRTRGSELGRLLGAVLRSELIAAGHDPAAVPIIPVPMSFWRRLTRGIDHTLVVARAAAKVTGGPIVPTLTRRHGPPQATLPASERARNMSRRMAPRSGRLGVAALGDPWPALRVAAAVGVPAVLLDDVTTTGATLREACRAVRAGCRQREIRDLTLWTAVLTVTPTSRADAN